MTAPLESEDPLASLLVVSGSDRPGMTAATYRSGRVVTWDTFTFDNVIMVDGVEMGHVPVLPGPWSQYVVPGDTVTLLATSDGRGIATYLVLGVPFTPPNDRFVDRTKLGYANSGALVMNGSATFSGVSLTALPGTNQRVTVQKYHDETVLDIAVRMTAYGDSADTGFNYGVIIGGAYEVYCGFTIPANGTSNSRKTFAGGNASTPIPAASYVVQGAWQWLGGNAVKVDAGNDYWQCTVREVWP
jgi:hypothetical protein